VRDVDTDALPRVAYEGQSGSKDRGDPQVIIYQLLKCHVLMRNIDVESIRRQPSGQCH
jgi:hypothetical protein